MTQQQKDGYSDATIMLIVVELFSHELQSNDYQGIDEMQSNDYQVSDGM